jgi:hypothetical protein
MTGVEALLLNFGSVDVLEALRAMKPIPLSPTPPRSAIRIAPTRCGTSAAALRNG